MPGKGCGTILIRFFWVVDCDLIVILGAGILLTGLIIWLKTNLSLGNGSLFRYLYPETQIQHWGQERSLKHYVFFQKLLQFWTEYSELKIVTNEFKKWLNFKLNNCVTLNPI